MFELEDWPTIAQCAVLRKYHFKISLISLIVSSAKLLYDFVISILLIEKILFRMAIGWKILGKKWRKSRSTE